MEAPAAQEPASVPTMPPPVVQHPGHICDTNVKIEQIEADLQKHFKTTCKVESYEAVEIGAGKGFLSCTAKPCLKDTPPHVQVTLHWSSPTDEALPTSVIVKIPSMKALQAMMAQDETMAVMFEGIQKNLTKLHLCEVTFYTLHGDSFVIPTVRAMGAHRMSTDADAHPAYIIQEDLTDSSTQIAFGSGYSLELTKDIVGHIARMQAWSLQNEWRNADMTMSMQDFMTDAQLQQLLDGMTGFHAWLATNDDMCAKLGEEVLRKFKLIQPTVKAVGRMDTLHKTLGLPDVMVHGDMWCNNILLMRNADGTPGDVVRAFIDWQIIHAGSPGEDLARLLTSSVSASMRLDHGEAILRHYYDTLCTAVDGQAPFEYDVFIEAYERSMLIFGSFFLPMFQKMIAMMSQGLFLPPGTDTKPIVAKFMDDMHGLIVTAVELNDKYPDMFNTPTETTKC